MKSSFVISACIALFVFAKAVDKVSGSPQLILSNNGPAVLGANITFSAELLNYYLFELNFVFNDGVQSFNVTTRDLGINISRAFEGYDEGHYCMDVFVEAAERVIFKKILARNRTCFELKRYLIGDIVVYQRNSTDPEGVSEVAVGENFTAVLNLYDPNNFLNGANMDYGWSIEMHDQITINNSFVYTFSDAGDKLILVRVTATFPDNSQVFGYFSKTITAKVPVNSVNVTGNPFLHHGDFLMLNVSCSGTPPFEYCSEILEENVTIDNFTCTQVSIFTTCHMEIKRFLRDGKYQIGIYIGNDVKEVKRVLEVMVYNVDIKPNLSTIIIPIVCSLLTLIIIATGISFYIQQSKQMAVEVANFDFVNESDSYVGERTFFEKISDSFTCRNCQGQNRWSCVSTRSESDPLLDDHSLPNV